MCTGNCTGWLLAGVSVPGPVRTHDDTKLKKKLAIFQTYLLDTTMYYVALYETHCCTYVRMDTYTDDDDDDDVSVSIHQAPHTLTILGRRR